MSNAVMEILEECISLPEEPGYAREPAALPKTYHYHSTVTIGDTNLMQNMYFCNAFKISGIVRELWIRDCVENFAASLSGGLLLITKDAHCEYKKSFYLYDDIIVKMQFYKVRSASTKLLCDFYKAGSEDLYMRVTQTIAFADADHKLCRMPANFMKAFKAYETDKL